MIDISFILEVNLRRRSPGITIREDVEDHEEVYIPGASHLGKLNHCDLRRLNHEADFDTRYIMLSNLL